MHGENGIKVGVTMEDGSEKESQTFVFQDEEGDGVPKWIRIKRNKTWTRVIPPYCGKNKNSFDEGLR